MSTSVFETQLAELKGLLAAESDSDLARALGISRYAVAKWRKAGSIPAAYSFLVSGFQRDPVEAAVLFIIRRDVYRHPNNSYFLRAALEALHGAGVDPTDDAAKGEAIITRLMGMASDACTRELGKPRCEIEGDYAKLIAVMSSERWAERLARTLKAPLAATPQSDSAIGLRDQKTE